MASTVTKIDSLPRPLEAWQDSKALRMVSLPEEGLWTPMTEAQVTTLTDWTIRHKHFCVKLLRQGGGVWISNQPTVETESGRR